MLPSSEILSYLNDGVILIIVHTFYLWCAVSFLNFEYHYIVSLHMN